MPDTSNIQPAGPYVGCAAPHSDVPALRPSEYTAALIRALHAAPHRVRDARAVEIGCGSGVVLAALGALGAGSLCGVDIEPAAIEAATGLLADAGYNTIAELHCGTLWAPVAGRRFDLVVANLPHFPMADDTVTGRLRSWSAGGEDGRRLLDPFLAGLAAHLEPGGSALVMHNAFVDIERSRSLAAQSGLTFSLPLTMLVYVPAEKLARMTGSVLAVESGRTLHRYGPYTFAEVHVAEFGKPDGAE